MSPRTVLLVMLMIGLSAVLAAERSSAQPDQDWDDFKGWEVRSFKVEGLPGGVGGDLAKGLAQTGKWKLIGGMQRPEFSVRMLAEDMARVRLYLARNGYPAAVVEPVAVPDPETKRLELVLQVRVGDPVRISRIDLNGWPENVALPDTSETEILAVGEVVQDTRVEQARIHLINLLLDVGYATVDVVSALEPGGPGSVAIVFDVTPGDFYRITEVEVSGCSDDLMKLAYRVLNVKPGAEYSRKLLTNASLDLRSTQLFSMVVLETEPVAPGELKLLAHLANGRMKTLEAAVGTFSDNPWLVRGGWRDQNLFKHGVGADIIGVVGAHRLGLGTGVSWIGFLSPRARTRAGIGFLGEDEDAYVSSEFRADFVQSFRPRRRDIWNLGLTISTTEVDRRNPDASDVPESQGRLLEIWTDVKWDWTADPLFPKDGGFIKTSFTVAPGNSFTEVPYVSIQFDASGYRVPLGPVVFAGRMRVGWAKPLGDGTEVLATRRFYGGGYNTHRGYGRRKLGPLDNAGDALGGEFVALAGLEARLPLIWIFDMAVFTDVGQIWAIPSEATIKGMPVAIGVSLDLRTPLGPVRGGYGWNVANRIEGQPRDIFHFGIGYPW